jgi:hypothetical protein
VHSIVSEEASAGVAEMTANTESTNFVMVAESKPTDTEPTRSDAKPADAEPAPGPLSVPLVAAAAPAPRSRPGWVDQPPQRFGEVLREVLVTEEWSSVEECERARDFALLVKTYEHVQQLVGAPYNADHFNRWIDLRHSWSSDHRVYQLAKAGIRVDYVHREIAKDEFLETVERSVGPMKKLYTLIEYSPTVDRDLRRRWEARQREERFWVLGAGAGSVLGTLAAIFGLLKIDTWTKGYYTKRLFLGVPAAIIGLVTLLAMLA